MYLSDFEQLIVDRYTVVDLVELLELEVEDILGLIDVCDPVFYTKLVEDMQLEEAEDDTIE